MTKRKTSARTEHQETGGEREKVKKKKGKTKRMERREESYVGCWREEKEGKMTKLKRRK